MEWEGKAVSSPAIRKIKTLDNQREQRRRSKISNVPVDLQELYPSNLTFYLEPPNDAISLKEFEDYAVARLTLLRAIERVNLTSSVKYSKDWTTALTLELSKLQLHQFLTVATNHTHGQEHTEEALYLARRYDHISHFILRLAYCRSEELSRWFVSMELEFFRFKFALTGSRPRERETFLALYNLRFEEVSKARVKEVLQELIDCNPKLIPGHIPNTDFYQVPFQYVLDLVRLRRVYLTRGMAYVPYTEVTSLVTTQFRKSLSHCIALTRKAIPRIQQDERLTQMLSDFDKRYTGKSYNTKKENEHYVSFEELPDKSVGSFPLCMKELYDVVERDHHLKHFGRLQLGLFLKGIGLPIEEATKFWRTNFTKKAGMDANRFDKQYLYNIRHMYGKEGRRADYTPYSCMKIITSPVGAGDHHGCPFRHSDATPLRSRLIAAKISETGVREILTLVKDKHYQIACQKYFEYTHASATVEGGINHPNQYYEESENIKLGGGRKSRNSVPTTRVNVYASSQSSEGSVSGATTSAIPEEEEDPELEWELALQRSAEVMEQASQPPTGIQTSDSSDLRQEINVNETNSCENETSAAENGVSDTPMEIENDEATTVTLELTALG